MMRLRLHWLPERRVELEPKTEDEVPFVQETRDVVSLFMLKLAGEAWRTLARLLCTACIGIELRPLLAHELAAAGATGVVLDILCQAPRHHPSWHALSTVGSGLLAALVRCEGGATEAVQPQALRMLLSIMESELTCGPARQAVATVLHCVVAQATVHRDKLLAVGALPSLLRVLRRLDVLCDLVAMQELLWTLAHLTDGDELPGMAGAGGGGLGPEYQPEVAAALVPLLFLYGTPWHTHHSHMAALAVRVLHVQVAGHDMGKEALRAAGVLPVLVNLVRRHGAPYAAAAHMLPAQWRHGRYGGTPLSGFASAIPPPDAQAQGSGGAGAPGGMQQQAQGAGSGQGPQGSAAAGLAARGSYAMQVAHTRPPAHTGCEVHGNGYGGQANGTGGKEEGQYGCTPAAALGVWTPWQRLLAVLLIHGMVPGLAPPIRRQNAAAIAARSGRQGAAAGSTSAAAAADDDEEAGAMTPSPLASDAEGEEDGAEAGPGAQPGSGQGNPWANAEAAGARMACYGLLLPLLTEAGDEAAAMGSGTGASASAVGGALLRRRLCPLRESLATLKTLLCDSEANQLAAGELGLVPLLIQLVAHGDMGLAWQAAEAAVFLSGGATGAMLVADGAVEELAYLLQESADALHGLTLRKQIQMQASQVASDQHRHSHHHSSAAGGAGGATAGHFSGPYGGGATGSGGAAAPAAPAPLSSVHVRPSAHAGTRPQRLYLVGRLPLDFTTSSSCFYGSHDAAAYCDYCTPSAAIKALLRLMASTPPPPSPRATATAAATGAAGRGSSFDSSGGGGAAWLGGPAAVAVSPSDAAASAVCRRFAAAGGLYGVLQLLHHEAAGVHHSKLAASLLTLLDLVLEHAPGAQDELRSAGGLGVLTSLLGSLLRPGVMDVFQLRVATCRTVGLALERNAANKLAAREHGLLPLLVSVLVGLAETRKSSSKSSELVLDDDGPLAAAALEALEASAKDSPGTQDALVALGLMHPLCALVRDERLEEEVRTAAVRLLTALVDEHAVGQAGALTLGVVPAVVAWLERLCGAGGGSGARSGGAGGAGAGGPAAQALAALLATLVRGADVDRKAALVEAGVMPVLLHLLQTRVAASTAAAGTAAPSAAALAASVLAALADGEVDIQNELVSQGALTAAANIIRDGSAAAPAALELLTCMVRANTFVKNTARHAGLPAMLVAAVRRGGLVRSGSAAAAAAALSELAAGNHANQEAVAMQGGLEVAVELARDAVSVLPLGGPAATATADGEDSGFSRSSAEAHSHTSSSPSSAAAASKAVSRLLRALFELLVSCVELNGGNQDYVRELGGVALLGDFLLAAAEALTAPPPPVVELAAAAPVEEGAKEAVTAAAMHQQHHEQRVVVERTAAARVTLSPAVAAACGAVAALVRESRANLARLEEQPGLGLALFKLLVATDAATSSAAALALEWLVVRSPAHLEGTPSREVFELDLCDMLVLTLYVPYGPTPLDALPRPAHAHQHAQGPWHAAVTALMPADGVTAAAVRDVAAVLTAVADAADALEAQQQQQQQQQTVTRGPGGKAAPPAKPHPGQSALPALEAAPLDSLAADHCSGLALNRQLSGTGAGGPGSQAWWAALAGSAAGAFQRVANGALLHGAGAGAGAGGAAGGGGGGSSGSAHGHASVAALEKGAGSGAVTSAAGPAQERRRQVTWMLFLLVARSAENRARVRRLVRTSLLPLAQQLANAEACRVQLEAAAAAMAAAAAVPASSASAGGIPTSSASLPLPVGPMHSAALESASSLMGHRLPISTSAMEELGTALPPNFAATATAPLLQQHQQDPQPGLSRTSPSAYGITPPGGASAPVPSDHAAAAAAAAAATPFGSATSAAAAAGSTGEAPGGKRPGGNVLYGSPVASASPLPPVPPLSLQAGPASRDRLSNTHSIPGGSIQHASSIDAATARRLVAGGTPPTSRIPTASGSGGFNSAVAGVGIATSSPSGSGNGTPRLSLSGAAAAAFTPGGAQLGGGGSGSHGSRAPSPSSSRSVLLRAGGAMGSQDAGVRYPPGGGDSNSVGATAGAAAPAAAPAADRGGVLGGGGGSRAYHAQISAGGSSGVMSDDDELAMIQQEVALLANATSVLASGSGSGGGSARGGMHSVGNGGGSSHSPAASPARWGVHRL